MSVTLAPLPEGRDDLLRAVELPPEQHAFAEPPAVSMAGAGQARDGHLILENGRPVGFFAIDRDYPEAHDFAPADSIGLRMFCIDRRAQGRGLATAACRLLGGYLAARYPGAMAVYLTVNHRNPGARAAYLKGGFVLTGADYLGGAAGPQHIMRLALSGAAAQSRGAA